VRDPLRERRRRRRRRRHRHHLCFRFPSQYSCETKNLKYDLAKRIREMQYFWV